MDTHVTCFLTGSDEKSNSCPWFHGKIDGPLVLTLSLKWQEHILSKGFTGRSFRLNNEKFMWLTKQEPLPLKLNINQKRPHHFKKKSTKILEKIGIQT